MWHALVRIKHPFRPVVPLAAFALLLGFFTTATRASAECTVPNRTHLFFVTDRAALNDDRLFSGERGLTKNRDAVFTGGILTQPIDRTALRQCASRDEFYSALQSDFERKRGRQILIYVHGYYTTFRRAADDAFPLARTLHFPGPVIVYSWPSKVTSRLSYVNDEDNAGWSGVHFRDVLTTLLDKYPGMPISFIAHSLGARFVADGLDFIRHGTCPKCLGRVLFFAPDIDTDTLRTGLTAAGRCSGRPPLHPAHAAPVTLYVSNKDVALRRSQALHGHQRAGQTGSELLLCNDVDAIDVGYFNSSDKFGHSYQTDKRVAEDARDALAGRSPASRRRRLTKASRDDGDVLRVALIAAADVAASARPAVIRSPRVLVTVTGVSGTVRPAVCRISGNVRSAVRRITVRGVNEPGIDARSRPDGRDVAAMVNVRVRSRVWAIDRRVAAFAKADRYHNSRFGRLRTRSDGGRYDTRHEQ